MICSKCNVDKQLDQYETYWHSTQQKMRTRKVCKTCYNEQKRIYRETIKMKKITQPVSPEPATIDYSDNPLYKQCMDCHKWKLRATEFYTRQTGEVYLNRCKQCEHELEKRKREDYLKENCGSEKVLATPGKFTDIYQKQCTFEFLKELGYIYQEDNNVWIKPGVKEIVDGKIVFLKINKRKNKKHHRRKVTTEIIEKIVYLKSKGLNYNEIAYKLNLSNSTIRENYLEWKNMSK